MNQALEIQLNSIINIRRRVFGFRTTSKLTERTYIKLLAAVRKQWRLKLRQLARSDEQLAEFHELSVYNPNHWQNISLVQLQNDVEVAYQHTKKLLAYRLRKQRYNEFKLSIENREYSYQVNKLGKVIKSVMGSKRIYYSMEELRIDGQRLIESGEIHRILMNHFQQWFETPQAELQEDWPASFITVTAYKHNTT